VAVGLVGQQVLGAVIGLGEGVKQRHEAGVVSCLTGREQHGDRANPAIDQGMDFGGQSAPGATYSVIIRFGNLVIRLSPP
jgi:hypothetical protein